VTARALAYALGGSCACRFDAVASHVGRDGVLERLPSKEKADSGLKAARAAPCSALGSSPQGALAASSRSQTSRTAPKPPGADVTRSAARRASGCESPGAIANPTARMHSKSLMSFPI
jgi:hypothetical protein